MRLFLLHEQRLVEVTFPLQANAISKAGEDILWSVVPFKALFGNDCLPLSKSRRMISLLG